MAQSIVERDLSQLLEERGIKLKRSIGELLQEQFGKNFYSDMDNKQKKLAELEDILDEEEQKLRDLLKKAFFDDGAIIDDIIYHLNTGKSTEEIEKILNINGLISFDNNLLTSYSNAYQNFKDQMIENIKYIGEIGEKIRGDSQYYTIGIDSGGGKLRNVILDSEQWYELISQNKYFSLQRDQDGQRVLATNRQWTGELRDKIDPKTGKTIKEKVYSPTRGITGGELAQGVLTLIDPDNQYSRRKALSALDVDPISQQIWDSLKESKIYTQKSLKLFTDTNDEDVLKEIFASRKYEILNSGIWDTVYKEEKQENRQKEIDNIIGVIQKQGFEMENIFGGARGDTLLAITQRYFSTQQKFFGTVGKQVGFQVMDVRGLNNAMSFYKNKKNIEMADQKANEEMVNTPQVESAIMQTGMLEYQQSSRNLFIEFFASLSGVEVSGDTGIYTEDDLATMFK